MPKSKSDLLHGTLDLLILKTLALEPMHGWGITQGIQQISDGLLQSQSGIALSGAVERVTTVPGVQTVSLALGARRGRTEAGHRARTDADAGGRSDRCGGGIWPHALTGELALWRRRLIR
jgi:hypothetical protein